MNKAIILDTEHLKITSYGNGEAYSMVNHLEGMEVYVQGEDASLFASDLQGGIDAWDVWHQWEDAAEPATLWQDIERLEQDGLISW